MDEVFVPEENKLPAAQGLNGPFSCLNSARLGIAWGALGAAETCWHAALQYTLERKQRRLLAAISLFRKSWRKCKPIFHSGCKGVCRPAASGRGQLAPPLISLLKRNSCLKALDAAREDRCLGQWHL